MVNTTAEQHPIFRRVWEEFISAAAGLPVGTNTSQPSPLDARRTSLPVASINIGGVPSPAAEIIRPLVPLSEQSVTLGGQWRPGGIGCLIARNQETSPASDRQRNGGQRRLRRVEDFFTFEFEDGGINQQDSAVGPLPGSNDEDSLNNNDQQLLDSEPHLSRYRRLRNPRRNNAYSVTSSQSNSRNMIYRRPVSTGADGGATVLEESECNNVPTFHFSTASPARIASRTAFSTVDGYRRQRQLQQLHLQQTQSLQYNPEQDQMHPSASLASIVSGTNQVAMNAIERLERIQRRIFEIHRRHAGLTGQRLASAGRMEESSSQTPSASTNAPPEDSTRPIMLRQTLRLFRNRWSAGLQDRPAVSNISTHVDHSTNSSLLIPPPPSQPPPPLPAASLGLNDVVDIDDDDDDDDDEGDDNGGQEGMPNLEPAASVSRRNTSEYRPLINNSRTTATHSNGIESGDIQWFTSTILPRNVYRQAVGPDSASELPSSSYFIQELSSTLSQPLVRPPPDYHVIHGSQQRQGNLLSRSIVRQIHQSDGSLSSADRRASLTTTVVPMDEDSPSI